MSLGELFRKQKDYKDAAEAYDEAGKFPHPNHVIVANCALNAGEMYDLLRQRETAIERYKQVMELVPNSDDSRAAAKYLKRPFQAEE